MRGSSCSTGGASARQALHACRGMAWRGMLLQLQLLRRCMRSARPIGAFSTPYRRVEHALSAQATQPLSLSACFKRERAAVDARMRTLP